MRPATCLLLFYFAFWLPFSARSTEVDSIHTVITPVQCHGLRNGMIQVDTVFGGEKPFYYSLDGQSFTTNPIFDRLWAGDYSLFVRDASGGISIWPFKIKEPAELQVKLVASETKVSAGASLNLRALASVESEFLQQIEWLPQVFFPRQDTLKQTFTISEPLEISITLMDLNGCKATDRIFVELEEPRIYIPNAIKPGSASDAYFTVFSGEGVRRVVSLQVFSRGGSMIFERSDFQPNAPLLGWGGRWNGKTAQAGVYPYWVVVELFDGKQVRYEGNVTVVN
jgi:hypothetical protein